MPTDPDPQHARRAEQERARFAVETDVHALPPIFHCWSNRYLRPKLEALGCAHPEDFFARGIAAATGRRLFGPVRVLSIGAGNCDAELAVARLLRDRGVDGFHIECLEINAAMLERGRAAVAAAGLARHFTFVEGDFNRWRAEGHRDVVLANQSLHHVVALEQLFDEVRRTLEPDGRFLVSDMIGRNGHRRWPEALALVRELWRELPHGHRYNVQLRRQEDEFLDWDCSMEGFEGIRAQDVLPLLMERFGFVSFLAWGNLIDPFIDRSFGPHFDPARAWDREFIDRVHARDEAELAAGRITPTHLIATLTCDHGARPALRGPLTPETSIRRP